MQGLEHATPGILLLLLILVLPVWICIKQVRKDPSRIYIRRIPGVDAVDEAVGRTAEIGRPAIFGLGARTTLGPVLYSILGVLTYVAQKCARYRTKLFVPSCDPQVMAVMEDRVRDAYRQVGRAHQFDPHVFQFLSEEQFAYASGYMGLVHREQVTSTFLLGSFAAESLIMAEAGQQVGAMQVAGSVYPEQVPFFIATCDYTLIGEELFAVSSYLTREPVQLGSLRAQDIAKLMVLILIFIGVGIASLNALFPTLSFPNVEVFLTVGWESLVSNALRFVGWES